MDKDEYDDYCTGWNDGDQDAGETIYGAKSLYLTNNGMIPPVDFWYWQGYESGWNRMPCKSWGEVRKRDDK